MDSFSSFAVLILAAGQGRRMHSSIPKVCHKLAQKTILEYVLDACHSLPLHEKRLIVSSDLQGHSTFADHKAFKQIDQCIQPEPLGTADAVWHGMQNLPDNIQHILIMCGDVPTMPSHMLSDIWQNYQQSNCAGIVVGMCLEKHEQQLPYGRLIHADTLATRIIEWNDATSVERECHTVNSGIYILSRELLDDFFREKQKPQHREFYLTDIVEFAYSRNKALAVHIVPHDWVRGINNRVDLAHAHEILQKRWRCEHMERGVTMMSPDQITLASDTKIGNDVCLEGPIWMGLNVTIEPGAYVYPYTVLSDCHIGERVHVGPFAHLRGNTILHSDTHIGNFVEVKNSTIGSHSKAKHLSYIGDSVVGEGVNMGAGTVTANYDGQNKHTTRIQNGAQIGVNTSLIAPVTIGQSALVGAGSVITDDVPEGVLALARSRQIIKKRGVN